MDGYKAYRYYLALKLHFGTDKFDVFSNHGAVKYSREKFMARNDRYIFEKLSQKFSSDREYIQFIASNFMYGNPDVVYSGAEAEDNYIEYIKRKQSITNVFWDDITTMIRYHEQNAGSMFEVHDNKIPSIISLYLSSKITLESLRILDDRYNILHEFKMTNQTLYKMFEDTLRIVEKSKGFVKYDTLKTDPIIEELMEELGYREPYIQKSES